MRRCKDDAQRNPKGCPYAHVSACPIPAWIHLVLLLGLLYPMRPDAMVNLSRVICEVELHREGRRKEGRMSSTGPLELARRNTYRIHRVIPSWGST